jgi:hypothetical protein
LAGCPFRIHHNSSLSPNFDEKSLNIPERFGKCYESLCSSLFIKNPWEYFILSNIIYPWNINLYAEKYNIKKFRLENKRYFNNNQTTNNYFDFYKAYIKGIENFDEIKNIPFRLFSNYTSTIYMGNLENLSIGEIKKYLPDIKYFEENGYNCLNVCKDKCNYCYNLAEKLNNEFPISN